jgi:glycosyltransferase involved in cell wall biosynthesis
MKIGFDVSQTGKSKAGCGFFADGLIRQIADSDVSNEYILYPAVGDLFWDPECHTATFASSRSTFQRLDAPVDFETSKRFWKNPGIDFDQKLGSPNIVHVNNFFCPQGLKTARLVYTLYDLHFLIEPEWTTEQNRTGCFQGVFRASVTADFVVAISQHSREHFLSTFPHYPRERVSVIYPATRFDSSQTVARPERFRNLEPDRFWLTVGTIEPRKNHLRLLEARRILKEHGALSFPLVLAGGQGWLMDNFDPLVKGLDPDRDIFLPGYVSDAELSWLFRNCFAFIYPSLFEGFGMPVLEALGFGAVVLCSNTSALPEAAGDAALYFDPSDSRSIAAAMEGVLIGEVDRASLKSAALAQAKRFSWAHSADLLRALYQEVAALPRCFKGKEGSAGAS